jgi:eukaryotic-like serine/threonine-protein kinase
MFSLADHDPRSIGPYRVIALLGEGGMGRVYLAIGPDRHRVALKRILPQLSRDPGFRQRFSMEVEAARQVSGPHTVRLVDADTAGAEPWSASEFVLGPTLAQAVEEGGPLPEDYVRSLGMELALALSGIHGAGLIHRDVKPSNVLLATDGARLLDFGVSRAMEYSASIALTQTGGVVGSPGYMSPEQAETNELTEKSDVFSLGCLLAMAASGRAPFEGPSIPQILYKVVHAEPDLEGVPASLRETIARCLAKGPDERPSPLDLRRLLDQGRDIATAPPAVVRDFAARQEAAIAPLSAPYEASTLTYTGPAAAYPVGPPAPARQGGAGRSAVVAAMAAAAALLIVIPLWLVFSSEKDPDGTGGDAATAGGDGDSSAQTDDGAAALEIPAEICDAVDVEGLLAFLGPEATTDRLEEGADGSGDFASCSANVSAGLEMESLSVMVARTDRSAGGDMFVCFLEGCDGIPQYEMPIGESTARPWTKGAIVENTAGTLEMYWYEDDVAVSVTTFGALDDGSEAGRDFLLDQGIAMYDYLMEQ